MVTHYAYFGEWQTKVSCGRYFTTDVKHTEKVKEVTCKRCKNVLNK